VSLIAGLLDCLIVHRAVQATKRGELTQLRVTLDKVLERSMGAHLRTSSSAVSPAIPDSAGVQEAAALMAARRGAVLVSSEERACAGILTPKDLLYKVVAQAIPAHAAIVRDYMTPEPDTMRGSATAVQALLQMQYGGYRNVPVVTDADAPLGVLDVLALLEGALLIGHEGSAADAKEAHGAPAPFTFKVGYEGLTLRVTATADSLLTEVYSRLAKGASRGVPPIECMRLTFTDDDGDTVTLTGEADVREAVAWAAKTGKGSLLLSASFPSARRTLGATLGATLGRLPLLGAASVALLGGGALAYQADRAALAALWKRAVHAMRPLLAAMNPLLGPLRTAYVAAAGQPTARLGATTA